MYALTYYEKQFSQIVQSDNSRNTNVMFNHLHSISSRETKIRSLITWIIFNVNKFSTKKTFNIIQKYYNTFYFYNQSKLFL